MSTAIAEYCRIETELLDLVSTIRVIFRGLSVTKNWPLFRRLFAEHREFKAEHIFGAIFFLLCDCCPNPDGWPSLDSDSVCEILEARLPRAVEFSRVVDDIPQDRVGAAWTLYEGTDLPDSFFANPNFLTALDTLAALRKGVQPRNVN
jgi:hypothetical protein